MRAICLHALKGVGNDSLGSIPDERQEVSYVVRRRLSAHEEAQIVGGACDIRRTDEALRRWERSSRWLPAPFQAIAVRELTS